LSRIEIVLLRQLTLGMPVYGGRRWLYNSRYRRFVYRNYRTIYGRGAYGIPSARRNKFYNPHNTPVNFRSLVRAARVARGVNYLKYVPFGKTWRGYRSFGVGGSRPGSPVVSRGPSPFRPIPMMFGGAPPEFMASRPSSQVSAYLNEHPSAYLDEMSQHEYLPASRHRSYNPTPERILDAPGGSPWLPQGIRDRPDEAQEFRRNYSSMLDQLGDTLARRRRDMPSPLP